MQFDHATAYFISGLLYIFIPLLIWWLLSDQQSQETVWWCCGGVILGLGTLWVTLTSVVPQPWYGAVTALLFFAGIQLKIRTLWAFLKTPCRRCYWVWSLMAYVLVAVLLSMQELLLYSHVYTLMTHVALYAYLAWLAWKIYRILGQRSALGIFVSYVFVVILLMTVPISGMLGKQEAWKTGIPFAVLLLSGILIVFVNHMAFMGLVLEGRLSAQAQSLPFNTNSSPRSVIERLFWSAERERVLAGMARRLVHEINQPLTGLSSTVSLMRRALQDGRWSEIHAPDLVDRMGKNLSLASQVVNQIRTVAKGVAMDIRAIDMASLVQESVDLLNLPPDLFHVEFAGKASGDFKINGNQTELVQVLVNLLRNAVQATDGKARVPAIRISMYKDQAHVCVLVEDNGTGFAAEALAKVGREIFSTKPDGMGLGLWISKDIIESHGGKLSFQNRNDGQGAQVRICLPLTSKD